MLNVSLSLLTLANLVSRSPFIALQSNGNFELSNTKLRNSIASFLSAGDSWNVRLHACVFRNFFQAPIINHNSLTEKVFTTNFKTSRKNLSLSACAFLNCQGQKGGAVSFYHGTFSAIRTNFVNNSGAIGGAIYLRRCMNLTFEDTAFTLNTAKHDGAAYISMDTSSTTRMSHVNVTQNQAELWTGGLRIERVGGVMRYCMFEGNRALVSGCFFDWAWDSSVRAVENCVFRNNTCVARGGAYTSCNIRQRIKFDDCVFLQNACRDSADSVSIENIEVICNITHCKFSGKQEEEVSMKYPESVINFNSCTFECNKTTK